MPSYRTLKTAVTRFMQRLTVLATSNVVVCKQASSILPFFDDIFISDEVGAHKPSTDFFEKIADQLNDFHSDSALMIGDSLTADIQGGNNAGIDSIWFNPKGLVNETPAVPTYQVKNYQEILTILSK